jgi:DNA replication protein DnaC
MRCLILDDLGTEKVSDWVLQSMYQIINARYVQMRQTVITSNHSLEELRSRIGDRIPSRIAEMCEVFELRGKDRRVS